MGEMNKLLRLLVQSDKEAKITAVTANPTGPHTKFTSQLASGQTRKSIAVYNNSDSDSGDAYWGYDANISPSGDTMIAPKDALISIPIADADAIPLYFCAASGEYGDLRVEELA